VTSRSVKSEGPTAGTESADPLEFLAHRSDRPRSPHGRATPGGDDDGQRWRSYGNENWEFDASGLMARRFASINDAPIAFADRRIVLPARN